VRLVPPLARLYLLGSIRKQAHLATLFMGAALFLLPAYINTFSLGATVLENVSKDFGLTLIGYFIVAMGIGLGASTVPADLEARSVYPVLARPISRHLFLIAHLMAVAIILFASVLFLGSCLAVALAFMLKSADPKLSVGLYGSFLQAVVAAALSLGLSVRWKPAAAATVTAVLFVIGSFSSDLFALMLGGVPLWGQIVKAALPDFSAFALKGAVVHQMEISMSYLLAISIYAAGWLGLALLAAGQAFEEVDL
jgi:ABC-type transport system involved in multi-copper enzyme maturation permease subunit